MTTFNTDNGLQQALSNFRNMVKNPKAKKPSVLDNILSGISDILPRTAYAPELTQSQQIRNVNTRTQEGLDRYYAREARGIENAKAPITPISKQVEYPDWMANAPKTNISLKVTPVKELPVQQIKIKQAPIEEQQAIQTASVNTSKNLSNITIPHSQTGKPYQIPSDIATVIFNAFGDINQAENAATVLMHPPAVSPISGRITRGENASFKTRNITISNEGWDNGTSQQTAAGDIRGKDGLWHSQDRGLFRINSRTFNGVMVHPYWGKVAREKFGINNWNDMEDPQKNAYMAKIIYEQGGWGRWVAAPPNLIAQGAPNLNQLAIMINQGQ